MKNHAVIVGLALLALPVVTLAHGVRDQLVLQAGVDPSNLPESPAIGEVTILDDSSEAQTPGDRLYRWATSALYQESNTPLNYSERVAFLTQTIAAMRSYAYAKNQNTLGDILNDAGNKMRGNHFPNEQVVGEGVAAIESVLRIVGS